MRERYNACGAGLEPLQSPLGPGAAVAVGGPKRFV